MNVTITCALRGVHLRGNIGPDGLRATNCLGFEPGEKPVYRRVNVVPRSRLAACTSSGLISTQRLRPSVLPPAARF